MSGCGVAWLPLATLATFAPEPPRGARPQELLGAFLGACLDSRCPVMDEHAGAMLQAPPQGSQGRSEASGDASLAPTAGQSDGTATAPSAGMVADPALPAAKSSQGSQGPAVPARNDEAPASMSELGAVYVWDPGLGSDSLPGEGLCDLAVEAVEQVLDGRGMPPSTPRSQVALLVESISHLGEG